MFNTSLYCPPTFSLSSASFRPSKTINAYMYVRTYVCIYVRTYLRTYACVCVCVCVCAIKYVFKQANRTLQPIIMDDCGTERYIGSKTNKCSVIHNKERSGTEWRRLRLTTQNHWHLVHKRLYNVHLLFHLDTIT